MKQTLVQFVHTLPDVVRDVAQRLLIAWFTALPRGKQDEEQRALIRKLLGAPGPLHCFQAKRLLTHAERLRLRCAVSVLNGRCVAAACFCHVPPPRRSMHHFSELLLLAVDRSCEGHGHGEEMLRIVLRDAAAAGSTTLFVLSNGSTYWRQSALGFKSVDATDRSIFTPWSHGIELLSHEISPAVAAQWCATSCSNAADVIARLEHGPVCGIFGCTQPDLHAGLHEVPVELSHKRRRT